MEKDVINFLKYLKIEKNYSNFTIINYGKDLKIFLQFLKENNIENYDKIEYKTIRKFLEYLYDEKYEKKTIARHISSLRSLFKYLLKENKIKNNPMILISNPKLDKKLPKYLYYDQIEQILSIPDKNTPLGMRDLTLLELLYSTGVRVSELINIKIEDINFDDKSIRILGKGNKERIVLYSKVLKEYLNDYLKIRSTFNPNHNYLFINKFGNKLTDRGGRVIIDNILKKGMVSFHISPHMIRHTFATHLLDNGADLKCVQELLGHKNLSSTQVYTHVSDEHLRKVYLETHNRKFDKN